MIIGKDAVLSVQDENGEFVPVGNVTDINLPEVTGFDQAKEGSEKAVVLICEDSIDIAKQLSVAFHGLGITTVEACDAIEEFNKSCRSMNQSILDIAENIINEASIYLIPRTSVSVSERDHGWYHKFDKPNKKRNLRR